MELLNKKLPLELIEKIHEGRWEPPSQSTLKKIFPGYSVINPTFFSFQEMKNNTSVYWSHILDEDKLREKGEIFYFSLKGKQVPGVSPGIIDEGNFILIGDCGVDEPIALYYSEMEPTPSVIYLNFDSGAWEIVFEDFESFIFALEERTQK